MSYAAQQLMLDRFGEREVIALTDRGNLGAVDATVLARALAAADDEINTYLSSRYALPLTTVPLIIAEFACDIARYRLCGGEVVLTDEIRHRYKDAIAFFSKVSKGDVSLGVDAVSAAAVQVDSIKFISGNRVFSRAQLSDFTK